MLVIALEEKVMSIHELAQIERTIFLGHPNARPTTAREGSYRTIRSSLPRARQRLYESSKWEVVVIAY